jgi:hypothetical protein
MSSFRGAGFAREPGIQEHGREKSKAWIVFMDPGPGPDGPSRNDMRALHHLLMMRAISMMRFCHPATTCFRNHEFRNLNNLVLIPLTTAKLGILDR